MLQQICLCNSVPFSNMTLFEWGKYYFLYFSTFPPSCCAPATYYFVILCHSEIGGIPFISYVFNLSTLMLCSSDILFCNSIPSSNGRDSFYFMRFQPTFMLRSNNISFCNPVPFSNRRVFIYLFNFSTFMLCTSNILLSKSLPFWNWRDSFYFIHTLLSHLQVAPPQHIIL